MDISIHKQDLRHVEFIIEDPIDEMITIVDCVVIVIVIVIVVVTIHIIGNGQP